MRFLSFPGALGYLLRRRGLERILAACGRGVIVGRHLRIRNPERIRLGKGVIISDRCVLDAGGGEHSRIVIGDGTFISSGTVLRAGDGPLEIGEGTSIGGFCRLDGGSGLLLEENVLLAAYAALSGGAGEAATTVIGRGCWLGVRVRVSAGARIGGDTIVGAHSVVSGDLPSLAVAYGNPARAVRSRS